MYRFIKLLIYFVIFISKIAFEPIVKKHKGKTYVICISSWYFTYIPLFQYLIAIYLNRRSINVVILYDNIPLSIKSTNHKYQNIFIKILLKLGPKFNIVKLFPDVKSLNYSFISKDFKSFKDNFTHAFKYERNHIFNNDYSIGYKFSIKYFEKLNFNFDNCHFIIPNGFLGNLGIFVKFLKSKNASFISYDSGLSSETIFSVKGIAAHFEDIPNFIKSNRHELLVIQSHLHQKCLKIIDNRINGNDTISVYKDIKLNNIEHDFKNYVLIVPNVSWDSAALGIDTIFTNQSIWILETINYIIENTKKNVVVRFHPSENLFNCFSFNNIVTDLKILESKYTSRLHIIWPNDRYNTYSLIKSSIGVCVHSSSVALEAIILGNKVISSAKSYFVNSGIDIYPSNKTEYFNRLSFEKSHCNNDLNIARICYLLTQSHSRYFSSINPCLNFQKYIFLKLSNIFNDELFRIFENSYNCNYNSMYNEIFKS